MGLMFSILLAIVLILIPLIGVGALGLDYLFGVVFPYAAILIFIVGVVWRVLGWARSPVPFRIPTTCGQQKTHDWIKSSTLDNPHNTWGAIRRMFLEIVFFRSLFRNSKSELYEGPYLAHGSSKWLWIFSLAFHYSFLVIFLRHFTFFAEPVPGWVNTIQTLDGFFQVGLPVIYLTDIIIIAAVGFLFLRRVMDSKLRYLSLAGDYFPLLLIFGVATSGVCLRYFAKTDVVAVKDLATGLISLNPVVPAGIGLTFFIHLFFVTVLFAYFPFSKLMHFAGVFMSPTRNLANNNRVRRHVNPWNYPVKVHTYEEYEDEFRDVMKAAGMPLEKEESSKE